MFNSKPKFDIVKNKNKLVDFYEVDKTLISMKKSNHLIYNILQIKLTKKEENGEISYQKTSIDRFDINRLDYYPIEDKVHSVVYEKDAGEHYSNGLIEVVSDFMHDEKDNSLIVKQITQNSKLLKKYGLTQRYSGLLIYIHTSPRENLLEIEIEKNLLAISKQKNKNELVS